MLCSRGVNRTDRGVRNSRRLSLQVFQRRIRLFGILSIGEKTKLRNISSNGKGNLNHILVPVFLIILCEPLSHLARSNSYDRVYASVIVGKSVEDRMSE